MRGQHVRNPSNASPEDTVPSPEDTVPSPEDTVPSPEDTVPSPEDTVTRPAEASPVSERDVLRSLVFVSLIVLTILTTLLDTNLFHRTTGVLWCATLLATAALSLITLSLITLSDTYVLMSNKMEDQKALDSHFYLSYAFCCLFCIAVFLSRIFGSGLAFRDVFLCWKVVSMTFTCGMVSAIWMYGGVEELKREMRAVLRNLWAVLYGKIAS